MIFIAMANVLVNYYYKLFAKNLVLYKYLSLEICDSEGDSKSFVFDKR